MILQTVFVCFRTQQSQVRNLGRENKSATPNAVVRWPSYIFKGHPLHQHSRGRTDFHCYLFSMNTFVQDAAWSSLFTAGQAENVKPTPRSAEVFPGCACPQRRGLAASPQLPSQLEQHDPAVLLRGQQQASMCSNCLKGGIKARHKILRPEAREECFHEMSVGYKALGVQTAIK